MEGEGKKERNPQPAGRYKADGYAEKRREAEAEAEAEEASG